MANLPGFLQRKQLCRRGDGQGLGPQLLLLPRGGDGGGRGGEGDVAGAVEVVAGVVAAAAAAGAPAGPARGRVRHRLVDGHLVAEDQLAVADQVFGDHRLKWKQ